MTKEILVFVKKYLLYIVIVLAVIAVIASLYFYQKYQNTQKILSNPTEFTKQQNAELVKKVGLILELPIGEEPTIATVTDKDKLKSQSFFAKSENGDKVLIFSVAKKAILYRPELNKIIDIAPINIGQQEQSTASATVETNKTIKVVLYNGTKVIGLTKTFEIDLKNKVANIEVLDRDDAKKKDYQKTLVIDLTGSQKETATAIAKSFNSEVSTLPAGEVKPAKADILVIIGSDYTKK